MVNPRVIHRDPTLSIRSFCNKRDPSSIFPFNDKNILLFGYARAALYEGLKILGLKQGDNVLVPNYICNVALAPMHYLNIKVKFYEVDRNLMPLWSGLKTQIDENTKAMVIVNYFGFPNDLGTARELCDQNAIYLIEDNAHSFLGLDNKWSLGTIGDISIFSLRKVLPIPNGAILLVNKKSLISKLSKIQYLKPKNNDLRFLAKSLIIKVKDYFRFNRRFKVDELNLKESRIKYAWEEYSIQEYLVSFSPLSCLLLQHFNFEYIREQRRNSYNQWLIFFSHYNTDNLKVIFPFLSNEIVPFCFPVLVKNQNQFIASMWKRGIECFPWPILPENSNEEYLSRRMVCLPVFFEFNLEVLLKSGVPL